MNPLNTITGTIVAGFVLAVVLGVAVSKMSGKNVQAKSGGGKAGVTMPKGK